jgi:glutamate-1-semialdehyde 2,1-aminomutase
VPDLTILGKVMGGGFPCAAFGGRAELMEHLAPAGSVYQAGTLSGNPVAVAAGLAALDLIEREDPYPQLEKRAEALTSGLAEALDAAGVPHRINRVASLFSVFLSDTDVRDHAGARASDHEGYARFFRGMLLRGISLPPSGYEGWFLSTAHGDEEIERTLAAAGDAAKEAATGGS